MSTLTLRDSLSRLLTPQEVDDNFTGLNNELAQAEADFYGNVDPASIPGVAMGPGFKWAHQAAGQMKIRNAANNGWFDLYELFSKIYTRASVVGTVIQSGGLPSGALIQFGSNPLGSFWRWADGAQIAVTAGTSVFTASNAFGSMFVSGVATRAWPAAFTEIYGVAPSGGWFGSGAPTVAMVFVRGYSTSGIDLHTLGASNSSGAIPNAVGVGRWY